MIQMQVFAAKSYREARLEDYERAMRRREGSRSRVARSVRRETEASWR